MLAVTPYRMVDSFVMIIYPSREGISYVKPKLLQVERIECLAHIYKANWA